MCKRNNIPEQKLKYPQITVGLWSQEIPQKVNISKIFRAFKTTSKIGQPNWPIWQHFFASNCHQEILIAFIFQTFWGIPRHHGHTVKCTGCPPFFLQLVHNPKLLGDQLFAITYMLFCVKWPIRFLDKNNWGFK